MTDAIRAVAFDLHLKAKLLEVGNSGVNRSLQRKLQLLVKAGLLEGDGRIFGCKPAGGFVNFY